MKKIEKVVRKEAKKEVEIGAEKEEKEKEKGKGKEKADIKKGPNQGIILDLVLALILIDIDLVQNLTIEMAANLQVILGFKGIAEEMFH